ncbi:MAG: hypothetical protein C0415_01750 [Thermodesulfovibrio sp.]|nr:hypothetical protein [Thermodesulfovibrio sp.]
MNTESENWLKREDTVNYPDRLTRLDWIAELMPKSNFVAFQGGLIAKYLFEEMRYCFVYAQYLASIALGFSFIEHTIAAMFYASGRNDLTRANASKLLQEAHQSGWLTRDEFTTFNQVRERRNPIIHFRTPLENDTIEYRMITENELPYSIIEADSRIVITAAMHLLSKHSF